MEPENKEKHIRTLTLFDTLMLIIGAMIGVTIFLVPSIISGLVLHPALLLLIWILVAVMTIAAALSYAEMASAMPYHGGTFIYLKKAYGSLMGFLYGWSTYMLLISGGLAVVAIAFGRVLEVFLPDISGAPLWNVSFGFVELDLSIRHFTAVGIILFLTWLNTQNMKVFIILQATTTLCKLCALVAVIIFGITLGTADNSAAFHEPIHWDFNLVLAIGIGMVAAFFAADSWASAASAAGDIRNPSRIIPIALFVGTGTVLLLYFLANVSYLQVLPFEQIINAPNNRVGELVMTQLFGSLGGKIFAGVVLISAIGALNAGIFSGSRIYYAMSKEKLFFAGASRLNPKTETPNYSLWIQAAWVSVLILAANFERLIDATVFAVLLFYGLALVALFILRRKFPDMPRPYKVWGYPYLPAFYILGIICVVGTFAWVYPWRVMGSIILMVSGIPFYFLFKKAEASRS